MKLVVLLVLTFLAAAFRPVRPRRRILRCASASLVWFTGTSTDFSAIAAQSRNRIVGIAEPDPHLLSAAATATASIGPSIYRSWKRCCRKPIRRLCWSTRIPTITGTWWKSAPVTAFTS